MRQATVHAAGSKRRLGNLERWPACWCVRAQCPKGRWRACEACQARLRAEGLEDEYELQSWFVGRISAFLRARGRQMIGWDEILEGGLAPGAIVMAWRVSSRSLSPVHLHAGPLGC